jgi:hypothetical protein
MTRRALVYLGLALFAAALLIHFSGLARYDSRAGFKLPDASLEPAGTEEQLYLANHDTGNNVIAFTPAKR